MDDRGIVGDVELLTKAWNLIKSRGPEHGLHLNASKCEWSWLDPECALPCPIKIDGVPESDQIKLVPHSEIQMLGVPLGVTPSCRSLSRRSSLSPPLYGEQTG